MQANSRGGNILSLEMGVELLGVVPKGSVIEADQTSRHSLWQLPHVCSLLHVKKVSSLMFSFQSHVYSRLPKWPGDTPPDIEIHVPELLLCHHASWLVSNPSIKNGILHLRLPQWRKLEEFLCRLYHQCFPGCFWLSLLSRIFSILDSAVG